MKRGSLQWGRALCIWFASWGLYEWLGGQSLQFLWWLCSAMIINGLLLKVLGPSRIEVQRTIFPTCLYAGEDIEMTVTISFKSWMPLPWIMLTDKVGDHTHSKLWFPGFRRSVSYSYSLHSVKRGSWSSIHSNVEWGDMFSWFRSSREVVSTAGLIVLPRPMSLRGLVDLPYGSDEESEELQRTFYSALPGQDLRDYIPGDPLNRIHWRNSARLGRLQTILPQPGRSVDRCIILDTSNEGYPEGIGSKSESDNIFEDAISASAGLLYSSALTVGNPSLWIGGMGRVSVRSGRTDRHIEHEMLKPLASVPPEPGNSRGTEILERAAEVESQETELLFVTGKTNHSLMESAIHIIASGRKVSIYCMGPPLEKNKRPQSPIDNSYSQQGQEQRDNSGNLSIAEDRFLRVGGRLMYIFEGDVYEITISTESGEDGEIQRRIK